MVECLADDGARLADVEAHEAVTFFAEHGSVVEGKAGTVNEEVDEVVVAEAELMAVEPYEERCLRANGMYLRQVLVAVVLHEADIVFHVVEHLLSPFFAFFAEGCDGGYGGEDMGIVELIGFEPADELLA